MKKSLVALAAASLLLAGCSSTVAGTPVADPSGVPTPETGSFATTSRTIGPTTQGDGEALEGYRMAEIVPYLYEIDPAMHFRGDVTTGSRETIQRGVKNVFGQAAADAVGAKPEVWVSVGMGDTAQGTKYDANRKQRGETVALVRMASPADAGSVVGPALRAATRDSSGKADPAKVEVRIPGYDAAVAYTQTFEYSGTSTVAFVAYKQFVIGAYGDFSVDQIRAYFDRQTKALDGFQPTPLDKVSTLHRDGEGVAKLTLAPEKGTGGYALPARSAVLRQSDVSRSAKTFADAGVDVVGNGGSTVYRAKDATGAQHVVDEFTDENSTTFTNVDEEKIKGVPGGICLTFPSYAGATTKLTWCSVAVGRYVAVFNSSQRQQAIQGIGAAYLILKNST
ncbi:DUF7373 family lipoprotein [Tsukamurella ocularis]|uniref:DUF7373 family lipoprotein n=1 Tax=Tsukamurella ocularis TaxID=1970234 RepID=UPI0021684E9B|nr:hypothetical protein [Tsukamurella ocularis]MCS3778763.1 hypothetical protein [Tsukamurella ocularis]MCS3789464.1 hypothetical protein [Tsukamurella ocularis]MCS3851446.1 hypothetical protein [Tsukamurella ocularis]